MSRGKYVGWLNTGDYPTLGVADRHDPIVSRSDLLGDAQSLLVILEIQEGYWFSLGCACHGHE